MSVIVFKCVDENKAAIKKKVFDIIHNHYSGTVFPNTKVKYDHEGEEVYSQRLTELMNESLCVFEDVPEGIRVEFDTTEDAGFMIADCVYHTGMGYCDEGLTYLKPLFDEFLEKMPGVCFEGECECSDKWVCDEYHCSYDGENFECDAEWMEYEE